MTEETETPDPQFGRVLHVASLSAGQVMAWIIIGAVIVAIAAAVLASGHPAPHGPRHRGSAGETNPIHILAGVVFGIVGLFLLLAGLKNLAFGPARRVFYERGVRVSRRNNSRSMAYVDTQVVYYIARTRGGTERVIELHPLDGSGVIRAGTTAARAGSGNPRVPTIEKIEGLRDHIVGVIAESMLAEVSSGKTIPWLQDTSLSPDGVIVNGRAVAWSQIDERANQSTGRYELLEAGQTKPLITLRMIGRNFLPGWQVVRAMRDKAGQRRANMRPI